MYKGGREGLGATPFVSGIWGMTMYRQLPACISGDRTFEEATERLMAEWIAAPASLRDPQRATMEGLEELLRDVLTAKNRTVAF